MQIAHRARKTASPPCSRAARWARSRSGSPRRACPAIDRRARRVLRGRRARRLHLRVEGRADRAAGDACSRRRRAKQRRKSGAGRPPAPRTAAALQSPTRQAAAGARLGMDSRRRCSSGSGDAAARRAWRADGARRCVSRCSSRRSRSRSARDRDRAAGRRATPSTPSTWRSTSSAEQPIAEPRARWAARRRRRAPPRPHGHAPGTPAAGTPAAARPERVARHEASSRARAGMTLIEVMVAMAIFAIVATLLYGGFAQTSRTKERIEDAARSLPRDPHGPRAHGARAVDGLRVGARQHRALRCRCSRPFIGKDSGFGDRIDFTSFSHQRLYRDAKESDQNELSYFVTDDPEERAQRCSRAASSRASTTTRGRAAQRGADQRRDRLRARRTSTRDLGVGRELGHDAGARCSRTACRRRSHQGHRAESARQRARSRPSARARRFRCT